MLSSKYMNEKENGFLIVSLIVTMSFMFLISVSVFRLATANFYSASQENHRINATLAADAGVDAGVVELNGDASWSGTTGEETLFTDPDGDFRTTYETTVVDNGDEKVMTVTGRTYAPSSDTTEASSRVFEVDLRSIGSPSGTNSIVTGVGGLIMRNTAKIVDGDITINGDITMSNSAQIGTTSTSLDVNVGHYSCPSGGGATYPAKCTSGNPISINNSAHIYGTVCAANQTDGSNMTNTGLDATCSDPPLMALPNHDRATQKTNVVYTAGTNTVQTKSWYTNCDTNNASGERTWQGPLKIEGDVYIGTKCEITIVGDVWITGDLVIAGSGKMIVDDSISLGGTNTVDSLYPSVMVDDEDGITLLNNAKAVSNASDVGIQFITYWSEASCSPDCTTVTGSDLFDSGDNTTIALLNSAEAPESVLYAKWTQVDLNNGGDIGALVGQTVSLRNSASVTFGAAVSGGGGSGNQTWLVKNYRNAF